MSQTSIRRDRLRKSLRAASLDGLLVTSPTNVGYLTGFTGEDSYLLLTRRDAIVLSDPRFTTQLEEECPDLALCIRKPGVSIIDETARWAKASGARRLGIEAAAMTVAGWQELSDQLTAAENALELVPTRGLVEALREIKDKDEIKAIRGAVDIAQRAFAILRASLRPEQTEKQVADDLEHNIRLLGGQATSFPSIVAVGPRAALPHARPTDQLIGASGLVLVDWGARARRYVSDLTRVLVTSRIPPKVERIYRVVLSAQEQAIAAIRPGVSAQEVDRVAREAIAAAGFGRFFGHGLGHGIGLDVHESPRLSANQDRPLRAGMVVTVEPGIYLPGIGGVRIEDDVLVTKSGHEVLSNLPKQWDEIATV